MSWQRLRLLLTAGALGVVASGGCGSHGSGASGSGAAAGSDIAATGAPSGSNRSGSGTSSGSSGGSGASGATTDASVDGASACMTAELDSGTCNDVALSPNVVTEICASGEPPQAVGGTIADGVYILESVAIYGQANCVPTQVATSWNICGDRWDVAQRNPNDGGELDYRLSYVATVAATSVSLTPTCESVISGVATMTRDFSVTPNGFAFITSYPEGTGDYVVVGTYAKQ